MKNYLLMVMLIPVHQVLSCSDQCPDKITIGEYEVTVGKPKTLSFKGLSNPDNLDKVVISISHQDSALTVSYLYHPHRVTIFKENPEKSCLEPWNSNCSMKNLGGFIDEQTPLTTKNQSVQNTACLRQLFQETRIPNSLHITAELFLSAKDETKNSYDLVVVNGMKYVTIYPCYFTKQAPAKQNTAGSICSIS